MCPVVDLNHDGVDEFLWGERCISIADGRELFCADRDTYRGHSDIVLPVLDWERDDWSFYTCRESDTEVSPRVARYRSDGTRVWGALDRGHIDMGWVATSSSGGRLAMATRIGEKRCGPDGREHEGVEQLFYELETGAAVSHAMDSYKTIPVDLNGDGLHEFVRGAPGGTGEVLNALGEPCGSVGGAVALATRVGESFAGEQVLSYAPSGEVALWFDAEAVDSSRARRRYKHPYYRAARRLSAVGYNLVNLGGL